MKEIKIERTSLEEFNVQLKKRRAEASSFLENKLCKSINDSNNNSSSNSSSSSSSSSFKEICIGRF